MKLKDIVDGNDAKMFHEIVKTSVTTAVSKIFEKSPLNSVGIRTLKVFNLPLICADIKVQLMKRIKSLT